MREYTKKKYSYQYISFVLLMCFMICKNSLVKYILAVISRIPILGIFTVYIPPVLILLLAITGHHKPSQSIIRPKDLLVPFFIMFSLLFTITVYPQNTEYIKYNYSYYIAFCIPAFFIGLSCIEFDDFMFKCIANVSFGSIIASYIFTFMYVSKSNAVVDELGQSYSVLLCTLMVGSYYFFSKNIKFLFMYILGIIYAISLGSRGPIMCLLVHTIICMFISSNMKKIFKLFISAILSIMVYLLLNTNMYINLLYSIQRLLKQNGMSSRVVDFIISGEFMSHTSGRNEIYHQLINLLQERPVAGYGLFGEWPFINWNAHELYLEVIFEYGIILGSILIIWYLYTVLITYFKEKDMNSKFFILSLISFVLVQGVMSYSHLRPELFLLLGCCIRRKRIMHHLHIYEKEKDNKIGEISFEKQL